MISFSAVWQYNAVLPSTVSLSGVGTLREVGVPIIDQDSCNSMYQIDASNADTVSILSDMICAGYQEGGKDSCQVVTTNTHL